MKTYFQVVATVQCGSCKKQEPCRVDDGGPRETPKILLPVGWRYASRYGDMNNEFAPVCSDACHEDRET